MTIHSSYAKEEPIITNFKIENKTIEAAIKELNKLIWAKYPGRSELLVAYIEQPYPKLNIDLTPFEGAEKTYSLTLKNIPITEIVRQLAQISLCHFRVYTNQIVIYGWHYPQYDKKDDEKTTKMQNKAQ